MSKKAKPQEEAKWSPNVRINVYGGEPVVEWPWCGRGVKQGSEKAANMQKNAEHFHKFDLHYSIHGGEFGFYHQKHVRGQQDPNNPENDVHFRREYQHDREWLTKVSRIGIR